MDVLGGGIPAGNAECPSSGSDAPHPLHPGPLRAGVAGLQVPDGRGEAVDGEVAFADVAHHPLGEGEGHHRRTDEAERPAGGWMGLWRLHAGIIHLASQ